MVRWGRKIGRDGGIRTRDPLTPSEVATLVQRASARFTVTPTSHGSTSCPLVKPFTACQRVSVSADILLPRCYPRIVPSGLSVSRLAAARALVKTRQPTSPIPEYPPQSITSFSVPASTSVLMLSRCALMEAPTPLIANAIAEIAGALERVRHTVVTPERLRAPISAWGRGCEVRKTRPREPFSPDACPHLLPVAVLSPICMGLWVASNVISPHD